jgi:hypothetical protein
LPRKKKPVRAKARARRPAKPAKRRPPSRAAVLVPAALFRRVELAAAATGKPRSEIGKLAIQSWLRAARLDPVGGVEAFLRGFDRMYGEAMRNLAAIE